MSQTTRDCATVRFVEEECNVGEFVSLVVFVTSVEICHTQTTEEEFLTVHGVDMDNLSIGTLRLWRFVKGDIVQSKHYIIRGLKVVKETSWNPEEYKYMPNQDGKQTVECSWRTAVEDVSQVREITECFPKTRW